ncbi:hypothetical protein J6590_009931 [Homalodisca vitripennis]|nr:hypothetical protein J6590_009931 [Homalodisca vitripennis]
MWWPTGLHHRSTRLAWSYIKRVTVNWTIIHSAVVELCSVTVLEVCARGVRSSGNLPYDKKQSVRENSDLGHLENCILDNYVNCVYMMSLSRELIYYLNSYLRRQYCSKVVVPLSSEVVPACGTVVLVDVPALNQFSIESAVQGNIENRGWVNNQSSLNRRESDRQIDQVSKHIKMNLKQPLINHMDIPIMSPDILGSFTMSTGEVNNPIPPLLC